MTTAFPAIGASAPPARSYWQKLLHRWLVEYNPLYLLSAALVLGGVTVLSHALAPSASALGEVAVSAIAEVYALALIGGAAFLVRARMPRPAVMLALLTVLYQGDLTMHTETSAYLGVVGAFAVAAWCACFVAKLYALAWAMRLSLPRWHIAVACLGALGLAVFPRFAAVLDQRTLGSLAALWLFGLFAARLWSARRVTSDMASDDWGQTVLRRTERASWIILAVLTLCHFAFWENEGWITGSVLFPVGLLLATRAAKSEIGVWLTVLATLVLVALWRPALSSVSALMAAAALCLRAFRGPCYVELPGPARAAAGPYRVPGGLPAPTRPQTELRFLRAEHPALARLLLGAVFAVYLSLWTATWTGGGFPAHVALLDLALTLTVLLAVLKLRVKSALLPLFAVYLDFASRAGWIPSPKTAFEWGVTSVVLGFALLLASVTTSFWLRDASTS